MKENCETNKNMILRSPGVLLKEATQCKLKLKK